MNTTGDLLRSDRKYDDPRVRDSFDLSKLGPRIKVRYEAVKKTQTLLRLLNE